MLDWAGAVGFFGKRQDSGTQRWSTAASYGAAFQGVAWFPGTGVGGSASQEKLGEASESGIGGSSSGQLLKQLRSGEIWRCQRGTYVRDHFLGVLASTTA